MKPFSNLSKAVFLDMVREYGGPRGRPAKEKRLVTRTQRLSAQGFEISPRSLNLACKTVIVSIYNLWNSGAYTDVIAQRLGIEEEDLILYLIQRGRLTPEGKTILNPKEQTALDAARKALKGDQP